MRGLRRVNLSDILPNNLGEYTTRMGAIIDFFSDLNNQSNIGAKYALRFYLNRLYITCRDGTKLSCSCNSVPYMDNVVNTYVILCQQISDTSIIYVSTDYFNNADLLVDIFEYNIQTSDSKLIYRDTMTLDGYQDSQHIIFI